MQDGHGRVQAALLATGHPVCLPIELVIHLKRLGDLGDSTTERLPPQTNQLTCKPEVVPHRQRRIDPGLLRSQADQLSGLVAVAEGIVGAHPNAARVWPEQPADHRHQGGLPCTVGAQNAADLTGLDVQIHSGQRHMIPVGLAKTFNVKHLKCLARTIPRVRETPTAKTRVRFSALGGPGF